MAKPPWVKGIFRCYTHKFSSDPTKLKKNETEEDQWYQHLRDKPHLYKEGNANCENCKKHFHFKNITIKVPANRRAPVVFCSTKCEKEFLGK